MRNREYRRRNYDRGNNTMEAQVIRWKKNKNNNITKFVTIEKVETPSSSSDYLFRKCKLSGFDCAFIKDTMKDQNGLLYKTGEKPTTVSAIYDFDLMAMFVYFFEGKKVFSENTMNEIKSRIVLEQV